jgi:hypothetical protein
MHGWWWMGDESQVLMKAKIRMEMQDALNKTTHREIESKSIFIPTRINNHDQQFVYNKSN